ncbi:MAG TPA: carotenoid biosynthesis protein [Methylomirabilota bacterium]|jgi:uncharacterized membrane protein|nr:carotenoid biosynthesis protein [Methylomirabilota bacterium]
MDALALGSLGPLGRVAGTLALRPYVFGFLALYLVVGAAEWGWRRVSAFTVWAAAVAFAAEWTSTRVGVPFGLYHYTGVTAGRELYLGNVPLFDPVSFSFLAFASLGLARRLVAWRDGTSRTSDGVGAAARPEGPRTAVVAGLLMMWLDLVIDPLAVRGDRWFLGRVFYYPEPGLYFGVPLSNFAGWVLVGGVIAGGWPALARRVGGQPSAWAGRLPGRRFHVLALYYVVLGFNLAVTAAVAEPALLAAGILLHAPLAAVVVSSLRTAGCADAVTRAALDHLT